MCGNNELCTYDVRAFVEVLRVRPCGACGVDAIYPGDDVDAGCVQLDPSPVVGVDVVRKYGRYHLGWSFTGRYWRVHKFAEHPLAYAFLGHSCSGSTVSRKGTSMTADPFGSAAPPGASGPDCAELEGKLILLTVHSIERGVATKYGAGDAVRCDVVDLTSGEGHTDNLLFGKVLTNQLTAGTRYVGRIGKGQAAGTNSPPWVWIDGDDNDKAVGVKYLTHVAGQSVSQAPAAPAGSWPHETAAQAAAPASAAPPWAQ